MSAPVTHIEEPLQQILTFDKLLHNTEGDTGRERLRQGEEGERECNRLFGLLLRQAT